MDSLLDNTATATGGRTRFIFLFLLYIGLFSLPSVIDIGWPAKETIEAYNAFVANTSVFFYNLFALEKAVTHGTTIISGNAVVSLYTGCNGVYMAIIFCSAIAAFPATWRQKLYGLAIGLVFIAFFNIMRVDALFYVHKNFPQYFDTAHIMAAQFAGIAFAMVLWIIWLNDLEKT